MITISIDVTLIDKARLKEFTRKNGNKAKFMELVLIETPDSEYGDYIVKQGVTKEEREARVEMPILGNGKNVGSKGSKAPSKPAPRESQAADLGDDDIPF